MAPRIITSSKELPQPLTAQRYAKVFARYLQYTSESAETIDFFRRNTYAARHKIAATALCVGPGDGHVDLPLVSALCAASRVRLTCVEPNSEHVERLTHRVRTEYSAMRAEVLPVPYEEATVEGRFGLVLASHSLYYFRRKKATLRRMLRSVAPGGLFVGILNTRVGIAQLQARFNEDNSQSPIIAYRQHHLARDLRAEGWAVETMLIEAYVNVTRVFTAGPTQDDMLSFFVDGEISTVAPRRRRALLEHLDALAIREGKRRLLFHPVGVAMARTSKR